MRTLTGSDASNRATRLEEYTEMRTLKGGCERECAQTIDVAN